MPASLGEEDLQDIIVEAREGLQDESSRTRAGFTGQCTDPAMSRGSRVDPKDIEAMKSKFPFLKEFSDNFILSHSLESLLKMETTSIKIQEFERGKAASSKLASNRDNVTSTFTEVKAGRDNRWDTLHSARFLSGAGCSAGKIWLKAREVLGDKGTVPLSTYDMGSIGLAGFVSKRGWCELHQPGSDAISLKMFNINACSSRVSTSSSKESSKDEEFKEIVDLGEFKLALRVLREAMSFVFPWNKSASAIEGFMNRSNFCNKDLVGVDKPALILTQFVDFALESNADRWKSSEMFLSTGDLQTLWDSFYGAKPDSKLPKDSGAKPKQAQPSKSQPAFSRNNLFSASGQFDDACRMYNIGKCVKPPGACTTRTGIPLRHVCNWLVDMKDPKSMCGKAHPRCSNH